MSIFIASIIGKGRNLFFLLFLMLPLSPLPDAREEAVWVTDSGHAEFTSSVPLHTFTGVSDHLTGMIDFEENVVDFFLDMETLKTGNGRRDRDMYRTLNIEEHPFAEFTGSLETPFDLNSSEPQAVRASGEFTLHGITRARTVEGTLERRGGELWLESEWVQDITEHQIEPPGILFYRVRDEMDVRIRARLHPQ